MLETNIQMKDIGAGLCVVENAIDVDQKFLFDYINYLKQAEEDTFTYVEENGIKFAINKTGFKFELDQISTAPERFVDVLCRMNGRGVTTEQERFIKSLEDTMYKILVEYCKFYPEAASVCWWRSHGHIATYSNGQEIGPHCDDQMPYEKGKPTPNEYSKHSNVSVNIYLNDAVLEEENLNEYNYIGGSIRFKHAKYVHVPKAGSAVIYPANYIGTHEVDPVTHGKRVAYLGAFLYGNPESSNSKSNPGYFDPEDTRIWMPNLKKDAGLEF